MQDLTTIRLSLVLYAIAVCAPSAQAQQPNPVLPDSLLGYELQGISLKTDPAAVHGILLARGFKRVYENPPSAPGMHSIYERDFSRAERRGEQLIYEDKLSGPKTIRGGGPEYREKTRNVRYQRLLPLSNIAADQQSWRANPDKSWFQPLFDTACAHGEKLNNRDMCSRTNWRLLANTVPGVSLSLTQFETSVNLQQGSIVKTAQ